MMIGMARRSSSATAAPAPLTSRTNEQGSVPTKNRRKVSGIPRNPFRRLSSKSRNPHPTSTSSPSTGDTTASEQEAVDGQRPHQIVVDDESDVQYIDLDHVVMASPGAGEEATRTDLAVEPERRTDHNCRRPDDEDNEGSLVRSDEDPLAQPSEDDATRHSPTKQLEGPTLERPNDIGVCPSSPPRSSRDDDDDASSREPSSPPLTLIPAAYHLPDSLSKRRRRASPLTSPWRDERSPSPPMVESPEGIEWARVQALDSKEEQLEAYWKLLYPDQPPTAAHLTSLDVCTTLKSCLKRVRRAADDGRTPGAPKRLQWGSNSAVEFTGQMPPLDFSFLSPDTVDLQFPSCLRRYQERHPVDEEMTQITKDNSAILAVWEGLDDDDDSSSESSADSMCDSHCFEDDDDEEDENYRPPPRRLSSAQKTRRRESGIFTPVHRLDELADEPIPAPSPVDLSPFDKLTLTSPCKGTSPSSKSCDEPIDNVREPSTSLSSSVLFVHPTEAEGNDSSSATPLLVETNKLNSVGPRSDSSWRQKLVQILSPGSSPGGPSHLELAHRECKDGQGGEESTTFRAVDGLDWLEPFDSSSPLRMLVDRSFVLARGALSLLPPSSNHVDCFDDDIEALAHADWIEIEIKVLETMVFQLTTGQMRDLSIKIGEQAERILRFGSSSWIRARVLREGQELALKEIEVRTLECQYERLKLLREQKERSAMEWGRDSSRLLQAISSFTLVDTDGADSYLSFPTPVHGLDVAAIHKMDESLIIETQKTHGPSPTSSSIDKRVDPTHPCSQYYVPLLDACLRAMSQISTDGGMGSLLTLELLLGRLELALWDVQLFCAELRDATVESFAHDGAEIVVVSATAATNAILRFVYDCSDARTVYSCRPTLAQLVVANASNAVSQSYPQEPLSRVATLLLEELEAQYP